MTGGGPAESTETLSILVNKLAFSYGQLGLLRGRRGRDGPGHGDGRRRLLPRVERRPRGVRVVRRRLARESVGAPCWRGAFCSSGTWPSRSSGWCGSRSCRRRSSSSCRRRGSSSRSWSGYREVLTLHPFARYLQNSLVVAVCSSAGAIAIGLPAAYSFVRFRYHGRESLSLAVLCVHVMPPIAMIIPLFVIYSRLGLLDTQLGLIVTHISLTLPRQRVATAGLRAAGARGAGGGGPGGRLRPARALWRVVIPIMAPGIAATAVLTFLVLVERLHLRGDPDGPRRAHAARHDLRVHHRARGVLGSRRGRGDAGAAADGDSRASRCSATWRRA